MRIDLAIVPVAGRGTRMLPATKSCPKEMLPVGKAPVVQFVTEELANCGIRRIAFVTGPGKTAIENHFDWDDALIANLRESGHEDLLTTLDFERRELIYFYTRQRRQRGLGHAVLCARSVVPAEPFVVALGDSILGLRAQSQVVSQMTRLFESQHADAVIAFESVPLDEVHQYGIAKIGAERSGYFEVSDLIEKPSRATAPSTMAVAARYVFRPNIFEFLERTQPGAGGEIQLTDAIGSLIAAGGKVLGVPLSAGEQRYDIGNFPSYFRAFVDFALDDPEFGEGLRNYLRSRLSERA